MISTFCEGGKIVAAHSGPSGAVTFISMNEDEARKLYSSLASSILEIRAAKRQTLVPNLADRLNGGLK